MNIKNERGSLTLFVAISMLFFMTFLLTLYISTTNQQKTQLEITARIKETYEQDLDNIEEVYNSFVGNENNIPIYNANQLKKIGSGESVYIEQEGKYYKFGLDSSYFLKNNIELNKYTMDTNGNVILDEDAEQWTPIGTETEPFKGNFDGNEYQITGLYINSSSNNLGLFGVIDGGTIENVTISGNIKEENNYNGIAGKISENTKINNCYFIQGKSLQKIIIDNKIEIKQDNNITNNNITNNNIQDNNSIQNNVITNNVITNNIEN